MALYKICTTLLITGTLSACSDPAVWSSVAPGYQDGITLSHVLIDVAQMPEPQRSWSEQALADEVIKLGVIPIRPQSNGGKPKAASTRDAVLTMTLISERIQTIDVPVTYYPGETVITTYEDDGKTITKIKERPGYHTGGYSYDVPIAQASFALRQPSNRTGSDVHFATIWTALAEVQGSKKASWAALSVDLARRAIRRLAQDKVIVVPERAPIHAALR